MLIHKVRNNIITRDGVRTSLSLLATELLQRMITFDPADRISVTEALKHPWLSTYHNPDDEPDCTESFRWKEVEELETGGDFKKAIWDEIQDYRRKVRGLKPVSGRPTAATNMVDAQADPPTMTTGLGLGQIKEETSEDLKTPTMETSPPPAAIESPKGELDSQRTLAPSEPPPPPQDNPRSITVSRTRIGRGERYYDDYTPSTTASASTPAHPALVYARHSSSIQQQNPPKPHREEGYLDESESELPRTGNYSYTVGPGTVGGLLETFSTVAIHESGRGLKDGLAGIVPTWKFTTERETDDELESEVPEEFKEYEEG